MFVRRSEMMMDMMMHMYAMCMLCCANSDTVLA